MCNIPNFQFGILYIGYHMHIIFYCIFVDPRISKQLKDPQRELGISFIFVFEFPQILKSGSVGSEVCLEGVIRLLDQIKIYPFPNFSLWKILANLAQVKQS